MALALVGAPGCAFVNLDVAPPSASSLAQPPTLGRGREVALSMPLTDARPFPTRCGMQKNGWNMDTASVHCQVPPARWMADALAQGLTSAGFKVRITPNAKTEAPVVIDGTLLQFFVEPKVGAFEFSPEADIGIKLVVTSQSGLRAERVFYVKGTETSFIGTESNFELAAEGATRDAVRAMVLAIASLLDRYPGIADASTGAPAVSFSFPSEVSP